MKERPIIFTELIPKILGGTKTQTRRVIKPQPDNDEGDWVGCTNVYDHNIAEFCPYGQVGDRLWCKETWALDLTFDNTPICDLPNKDFIFYKSMGDPYSKSIRGKWRSPLFMPRWASRITLEITGIRVERLQEITRQDAILEGYPYLPTTSEIDWYYLLWNSLNAKYPWESNPWVWVIEFKKNE